MPDVNLTIRAQNLAAQQFQRLEQDLQRSNRALRDAGTAASNANPAINRLRREYQTLSSDVGNVAAVTRQFATVFNRSLQGTIDAALQFEQLTKSLQTVSGSTQEANEQMERLVEVARLPGLSLEGAIRASVQLQAIGTAGEEAANVITQFGNALALGGGSSRDLNQITNAIRQMSAEGKILQEDLSIMTTRVAVLVPILQEAFGGTRAEDIRNAGLSAEEFISFVTEALSELPRAGDTAANAIENLSDTSERLQAAIGAQLLPSVRSFVGTTESLLSTLLNAPPAVQKIIAIGGVLGTTFLTVTAGAAGLTAALPALGAALTFLTANPIGLAITAIAAVTAGIVAWQVATADARAEQERFASALNSLNTSIANADFNGAVAGYMALAAEAKAAREELEALNEAQNEGIARALEFAPGADIGPRDTTDAVSAALAEFAPGSRQSVLEQRIHDATIALEAATSEFGANLDLDEVLIGERRGVVTRAVQEGAPPEQRAAFNLNIEGEISESDVANINSAVESLSMLGANTEVPQVLRDLNAAMAEADPLINAAAVAQRDYVSLVDTTGTAVQGLNVDLAQTAIVVPSVAEAFGSVDAALDSVVNSIELSSGAINDLREPIVGVFEALPSPADLPSGTDLSPLRDLNQLFESIQTFNATRTGAADIAGPFDIAAQADPNRDRFLGAFNLTSVFDDVADEFDGYGRQFGQAMVQGLIEQRGSLQEIFTGFVTASFQDLATVLGGNLGDQIAGALTGRLGSALEGIGLSSSLLGPLALATTATFAAPQLLGGLFDFFTEDEDPAAVARRRQAGIEQGRQGIFAGITDSRPLQVNIINAEEVARRLGITLGESGLLGEEGRDFAQEQTDLIAAAIAEGASQDPEGITDAIVQAFTDAGVFTPTQFNQNPTVLQAFDEIETIQAAQLAAANQDVLGTRPPANSPAAEALAAAEEESRLAAEAEAAAAAETQAAAEAAQLAAQEAEVAQARAAALVAVSSEGLQGAAQAITDAREAVLALQIGLVEQLRGEGTLDPSVLQSLSQTATGQLIALAEAGADLSGQTEAIQGLATAVVDSFEIARETQGEDFGLRDIGSIANAVSIVEARIEAEAAAQAQAEAAAAAQAAAAEEARLAAEAEVAAAEEARLAAEAQAQAAEEARIAEEARLAAAEEARLAAEAEAQAAEAARLAAEEAEAAQQRAAALASISSEGLQGAAQAILDARESVLALQIGLVEQLRAEGVADPSVLRSLSRDATRQLIELAEAGADLSGQTEAIQGLASAVVESFESARQTQGEDFGLRDIGSLPSAVSIVERRERAQAQAAAAQAQAAAAEEARLAAQAQAEAAAAAEMAAAAEAQAAAEAAAFTLTSTRSLLSAANTAQAAAVAQERAAEAVRDAHTTFEALEQGVTEQLQVQGIEDPTVLATLAREASQQLVEAVRLGRDISGQTSIIQRLAQTATDAITEAREANEAIGRNRVLPLIGDSDRVLSGLTREDLNSVSRNVTNLLARQLTSQSLLIRAVEPIPVEVVNFQQGLFLNPAAPPIVTEPAVMESAVMERVVTDFSQYTQTLADLVSRRYYAPFESLAPEILDAAIELSNTQSIAQLTSAERFGQRSADLAQADASAAFASLESLLTQLYGNTIETVNLLSQAENVSQEVLTIKPQGEVLPTMLQQQNTLRVEVVNKPEVAIPDAVSVTSDSPLPVTLSEAVTVEGAVEVTGTVSIGGQVIPVVIQNTEAFARQQNQDDALFQRLGNSA